jgi:hypothetical protein
MLEGFPLGGLTGALNTSVDCGNYIRCVLSTLLIGTYYSIERRWGKLSSRPPEHGNRRDRLSSLTPSPTGLYATQVHHRPHHQILIVQHGEAPSPAHACHSHPHFFPLQESSYGHGGTTTNDCHRQQRHRFHRGQCKLQQQRRAPLGSHDRGARGMDFHVGTAVSTSDFDGCRQGTTTGPS